MPARLQRELLGAIGKTINSNRDNLNMETPPAPASKISARVRPCPWPKSLSKTQTANLPIRKSSTLRDSTDGSFWHKCADTTAPENDGHIPDTGLIANVGVLQAQLKFANMRHSEARVIATTTPNELDKDTPAWRHGRVPLCVIIFFASIVCLQRNDSLVLFSLLTVKLATWITTWTRTTACDMPPRSGGFVGGQPLWRGSGEDNLPKPVISLCLGATHAAQPRLHTENHERAGCRTSSIQISFFHE